ncbi:MAG: MaoC family dehydratase, partial [Gemmatimonadetes bacterium]|nr:MaoC family dehydratase [Gemmatimonadota bacterium]
MSDKPIFNYAHYEPGRHYGAGDFAVDESTVAKWRSVYPNDDDPGVMPAGMLAMIVIDAVLTLNSPRPPGGVHGGQTFDIRRMPHVGETLRTDVWCLDKEIKKDRKWVRVRSETRAV